ncbi:MAG: MauE/DoxX family redox-associated membrane protein, partial [Nocardioides sp.]
MPSAPYVVPPLLLIATLAVSAVAKLRDPRDTASVFLQLRLPRVLLRLRAPRLLPYGELALAAFLLLAPDRWYVVATTATLLLFLVYLLVILRALRLPYPVSCSCFGRLGLGEVTRWTLARNALLLALALVTWADSWRGDGVAQRLGDVGTWAWSLSGAG